MHHHMRRFVWGFLSVPLFVYIVFVVSPYAQAFYISLTDWRGYSPAMNFVGLENFFKLVQDPLFWGVLQHNAVLLVALPFLTVGLGLFLAFMLNVGGSGSSVKGVRGGGFYRVVYFFPHVLSIAIIAVLWKFIYNPQIGLLNGLLDLVGLDALRQPWLGDRNLALWAVIAVMVWHAIGFYVVLFTAAMQSIPNEVFEAARIDGASRPRVLFSITVPLLWDTVQTAIVFLGMAALDAFAVIQIMTLGGPDNSTNVVANYLYETAFTYSDFGYASAMGVALFFLTLTLAVLVLQFTRRERTEFT